MQAQNSHSNNSQPMPVSTMNPFMGPTMCKSPERQHLPGFSFAS